MRIGPGKGIKKGIEGMWRRREKVEDDVGGLERRATVGFSSSGPGGEFFLTTEPRHAL